MKLNEPMRPFIAHRRSASFAANLLTLCVLAFVVTALSIFAPVRAFAFSLGKIRVTGALTNQFKSEIPVQTDGQEGLIVMLGSEADYKKLGLKRPDFLDSLQVQMGDHPMSKGDKIIYITSPDPIYQPSFNLVVKAYMNGGHIVENYFLALDFQKNITMEIASSKEEERTDLSAAALDIQKEKQKSAAAPSDGSAIASVKRDEMEAAKREDEIRAALRGELPVAEPLTYSKEQAEKKRLDEIRASEEALAEQEQAPAKTEPVIASAKEPLVIQPAPAPAPVTAPTPPPAPVAAKAEEPVEIVIKEEPAVAEVKPVTSGVRFKMYKVESGDSLYAISRKVGVEELDMDRLVVAVWKENSGKFIKGNLHGIRAGTKLDYEKAVDTARSMSRNEARQIISDQWEEWKKLRVKFVSPAAVAMAQKKPVEPAPAKKEEKKAAKEKPAPAAKVEQTAKPEPAKTPVAPEAPMSAARKEAAVNYGAILKALAEWKTAQGPSWEGAEMDALHIGEVSAKGLVDVKIAKRGPGGSEEISIQLKKESSGFKPLTAMKSVPAAPAPASKGKPFTVQVGAFRERADAEEMVKILRKKGHNAYVAVSAGKGDPVRVTVDRFATAEDAAGFSENLRKSGLVKFGRALRLPYALRLGEPMSSNDANSKVAELASKGVSAYIVSAGDGKASVMTGAYESEKSAREAAKQMSKGGLNPSVTQP